MPSWISIKKEQISSYLVYNIVNLGKMGGKAEPFLWRSVEDELAVKYLENLDVLKICAILNDVKCSICSSLDLENRLWVIIFAQERAPRQTFKVSTILNVNFEHNSLFFLVSCRLIRTSKCLLHPTLSISKRWNNMLPHLLTDVQKSYWNNK